MTNENNKLKAETLQMDGDESQMKVFQNMTIHKQYTEY